MSELDLLKQQLHSGDITLSFSAIKSFSKSPSHFIRYKLKQVKETAAMKKGSLIHCAILEPNEFENRYKVLSKDMLPYPDKDFRNAENKAFKEQFESKCLDEGIEIITPSEYEEAIKHIDLVKTNEIISPKINGLIHKEKDVYFEFGGFNWKGYIDGIGTNYELDLKTVSDATPDKLKWKLNEEKYHWQHFLYSQSNYVGSWFDFYNVFVDSEYGISLVKLSKENIYQAENELLKLLEMFKMCIENDLWHMNYEFWSNGKGYFEI